MNYKISLPHAFGQRNRASEGCKANKTLCFSGLPELPTRDRGRNAEEQQSSCLQHAPGFRKRPEGAHPACRRSKGQSTERKKGSEKAPGSEPRGSTVPLPAALTWRPPCGAALPICSPGSPAGRRSSPCLLARLTARSSRPRLGSSQRWLCDRPEAAGAALAAETRERGQKLPDGSAEPPAFLRDQISPSENH